MAPPLGGTAPQQTSPGNGQLNLLVITFGY